MLSMKNAACGPHNISPDRDTQTTQHNGVQVVGRNVTISATYVLQRNLVVFCRIDNRSCTRAAHRASAYLMAHNRLPIATDDGRKLSNEVIDPLVLAYSRVCFMTLMIVLHSFFSPNVTRLRSPPLTPLSSLFPTMVCLAFCSPNDRMIISTCTK